MQYLCSTRTWASQAVCCLCIHEQVLKIMSFHQIELNPGSILWRITDWFFFICKCASLKNAVFCQRQLIKHLWVSVSANCEIINLCWKRMAGEAWLRLVLFLSSFETNNIYIFGKNVIKKIALMDRCFPKWHEGCHFGAHLFKASKWVF